MISYASSERWKEVEVDDVLKKRVSRSGYFVGEIPAWLIAGIRQRGQRERGERKREKEESKGDRPFIMSSSRNSTH